MQELHSLIQVLSPAEWQSLQIFLTAFTPRDPARLKYVQLAKMLMEAENTPGSQACCLKLYGKKKCAGFEMLKSRLKEKVCAFLTTDLSNDKKQGLDEMDYAGIKIKKKSILFQQLLHSKNKIPLVYVLLDEIIHLSKKYEYYSFLVHHLRLKKTILSWKKGGKDFEKTNEEIMLALKYDLIFTKAEHYYYELIMLVSFSSNPDKQKALLTLKENIAEVQAGFEFTNSPMVNYYLKNMEMAYYQLRENHLQAHSACLALLDIVRNNKSVYRRQRMGVVHDNLSQCEHYLGNFKQAAECARKAQNFFPKGSANYCIALEQEFYALFAMKQYRSALGLANKMLSSATPKELGAFRHAKYNFLLANALFKLGRYKEVSSILSQKLEITKDKAGWEIGIRTLGIMAFVEMHKPDQASAAIQRLRKFMEFTHKKTPVSARDKTILKVLLILEREGFIFSSLKGNAEKYLVDLQSQDRQTRWEPFTHEVIPFHEWIAEKRGDASCQFE